VLFPFLLPLHYLGYCHYLPALVVVVVVLPLPPPLVLVQEEQAIQAICVWCA
jgi:hypothetical protein